LCATVLHLFKNLYDYISSLTNCTHTLLLSLLYSCLISHHLPSLFLFYSALIFCPSLRCYLMELRRDVRCYVRWQQSRQVKATLSSLETTCKLPTCSLAPFCFSSDHSPRCFSVANPLLAPSFVLKCQTATRSLTNADADYRVRAWTTSSGRAEQERDAKAEKEAPQLLSRYY